jgi:hypothetical protein
MLSAPAIVRKSRGWLCATTVAAGLPVIGAADSSAQIVRQRHHRAIACRSHHRARGCHRIDGLGGGSGAPEGPSWIPGWFHVDGAYTDGQSLNVHQTFGINAVTNPPFTSLPAGTPIYIDYACEADKLGLWGNTNTWDHITEAIENGLAVHITGWVTDYYVDTPESNNLGQYYYNLSGGLNSHWFCEG